MIGVKNKLFFVVILFCFVLLCFAFFVLHGELSFGGKSGGVVKLSDFGSYLSGIASVFGFYMTYVAIKEGSRQFLKSAEDELFYNLLGRINDSKKIQGKNIIDIFYFFSEQVRKNCKNVGREFAVRDPEEFAKLAFWGDEKKDISEEFIREMKVRNRSDRLDKFKTYERFYLTDMQLQDISENFFYANEKFFQARKSAYISGRDEVVKNFGNEIFDYFAAVMQIMVMVHSSSDKKFYIKQIKLNFSPKEVMVLFYMFAACEKYCFSAFDAAIKIGFFEIPIEDMRHCVFGAPSNDIFRKELDFVCNDLNDGVC